MKEELQSTGNKICLLPTKDGLWPAHARGCRTLTVWWSQMERYCSGGGRSSGGRQGIWKLTISTDSSVSGFRSSTLWSTALTAQKELAAASMTKLTLEAGCICFSENSKCTWNSSHRCWAMLLGLLWLCVWVEGEKESGRIFWWSTEDLPGRGCLISTAAVGQASVITGA